MTTTEQPAEQVHDTPTTPRILYVEWGGRRFGPYASMEDLHRDFELG
jgi:hypothetical protein